MKTIKLVKNKSVLHTFLLVFMLIILSQLVLGLGIQPAKTTVNSNEVQEYSGSFWVVNSNNLNLDLTIRVDGDMSDYVQLETKQLRFKENERLKEVKFSVTLPENVPHGDSFATIAVEQNLDSESENVVYSKIILKHKIIIIGEYPNKFITAKINFQEKDDVFQVIAEVENLGKEDINEIKTTYYVNDKEQTLTTLETDEESLAKGEYKLLGADLEKNFLEYGEFEVLAIIEYDDFTMEMAKKLIFGEPEIEITYFDKYFVAGIINPYSLELLNRWNRKVENIFVDIVVKKELEDGSVEEIDNFRTSSLELDGYQRDKINDYFDATNETKGNYVFSMVINFWNNYKMDQRNFDVELLDNGESIEDRESVDELVGMATYNEETEDDLATSLIVMLILIAFMLISGVLLFVFVRKKKEDGWE